MVQGDKPSNESIPTNEAGQLSLTIGGHEIPIRVTTLEQRTLQFYKDNPRIYSMIADLGDDVSQSDIEDRLCSLEHVKQLAWSIKANGGLIDPLIVHERSRTVFEGNSRLAAYRLLSRNDALKWAKVKCTLLTDTITEDQIFTLLGEYHIIGRKDWAPYEQAGDLWRRAKRQNVANAEMGISVPRVNQMVDVFDFMVAHDEANPQKWSYWEEYFKNRKIKEARKYHPEMDEIIVHKVKTREISKAIEIRAKVAVIAESKGPLLKKFLANDNSLERCYEQVVAGGATDTFYKKLHAFRVVVSDPDMKRALRKLADQPRKKCEFELKKIKTRISELLKII